MTKPAATTSAPDVGVAAASQAGSVALEVTNLARGFGDVRAVRDLSFQLRHGEVLALLGPNGAGKTTTVEICEGFLKPDNGTVRLLGHDPHADNAAVRGRIGIMLQSGGGYPGAKAAELLELISRFSADPLDPQWLLATLGLRDVAKTSYRQLSGGQQQRLSLACALVGRPEVVFLDEPTAGMDPHTRIVVWDIIDRLRADGVAVLLTTHLMDEAESLADRVVIIDHGAVVATGTPAEIASHGAEHAIGFRAPAGLDLTALEARLPDGYTPVETAPGKYELRGTPTPQLVATVTAWLADIDVLVSDIGVQTRSLEDVFLDITGRELREQ